MRRALACGVLLLAGTASAAGRPELAALFPMEAPIRAERAGLARLPLPAEVLGACRPDLSDLRVFDSRGRQVAYLLDAGRVGEALEALERVTPEVLGLRREHSEPENATPIHTERYELAPPPSASELGPDVGWELVFAEPHGRFVREVDVAARRPDGEEELLLANEPVFRLDAATRRLRLPLPPLGDAERLRVTIRGEEGGYLEPALRFEATRTVARARRTVIPLEAGSERTAEGRSEIELTRPGGVVPDLLEIETATDSFRRRVEVFDVSPGSPDARLGSGVWFRVGTERELSNLALRLRPARGSALRVVIENGDSPPLEQPRFAAVVRSPVLIFALDDGRGTLRFGGGRAHLPRYDLSGLLPRALPASGDPARAALRLYDPDELAPATLGEIAGNPEFDATPALAFAMRAGAEIDARAFTHRRAVAIEPSAEGLSRLRLAPEDAALARADLADVRVVDGQGRQWPYLLDRTGPDAFVPLEIAESDRRKRVSKLRLRPTVAPIRTGRVSLDARAPYFARTFRLQGRAPDADPEPLASGRLEKDARAPQPVTIDFSARRLEAFELEIDDGDDAPLELRWIRARVVLPELYLAAPEGQYTLLVGNEDATPPRYELEEVRDVVLAVASRSAVTGPLERNPDYSMAARLAAGDGPGARVQQLLVWAVLLAAVAILGALTLRAARQA